MKEDKATASETIAIFLFVMLTFFLIGALPELIIIPILISIFIIGKSILNEFNDENN